MIRLSTETVEGTARTLESVDDVEGGDGLPERRARMLTQHSREQVISNLPLSVLGVRDLG